MLAACALSFGSGCSGLLGLDEFGAQPGSGGGGSSPTSTSTADTTSTTTADATSNGSSTSTGGGGQGGSGGPSGPGGGGHGGEGGSGVGGDEGAGGAPPPIECTPGNNTNATGECDVLDPGSCPPGERCTFAPNGETLQCLPENGGPRDLGEPCAADVDCSGDLFCDGGACTTFCCPENDAPCSAIDGGLCFSSVSAPGDPEVYARTCRFFQPCEPLLDECIDPDEDCTAYDFDAQKAICIQSARLTGEGEPCMYLNQCGESAFCAFDAASNGNVCRQLCDVDDWMTSQVPTGGCPTGRTCTPIGFVDEWAHIGICLP